MHGNVAYREFYWTKGHIKPLKQAVKMYHIIRIEYPVLYA